MTVHELRKKLTTLPDDAVIYMYHANEFLDIDCVRLIPEDDEAIILPISDAGAVCEK